MADKSSICSVSRWAHHRGFPRHNQIRPTTGWSTCTSHGETNAFSGSGSEAQVEPSIFHGQTGKTAIRGMFLPFLQENRDKSRWIGFIDSSSNFQMCGGDGQAMLSDGND